MDTIASTYRYMFGTGIYVLLWLLAIGYLYKNDKEGRQIFVYPLLLVVVIFMNPIVIYFAARFFGVGEYSRVVWCVLADIIIAIAGTKFVYNRKTNVGKLFSFIVIGVILAAVGKSLLTNGFFSKATNRYKLSNETLEVCEYLSNNHAEDKAIIDMDILVEVHQYDATIPMYYGRWSTSQYIEIQLNSGDENVIDEYLDKAIEAGCSIIVLDNNVIYEEILQKRGWTREDAIGVYNVYKYIGNQWILTNYADESGNQGMFYTLYNQTTGELIVVDSGWRENANQVSQVILEYGGKVSAWFLTHFDNDHVDAFNEVYEHRVDNGIEIEQIYITPLDYDYYMTTLRDWDTPESYSKFIGLTEDSGDIVKLSRGQELDICGLHVQVFNAYDDIVLEYGSGDLPNNASLVFKIEGEEDSILFCGDCHEAFLADYLVEHYGSELQATYVQTGHHGNNSFPTAFYDYINPQYAFFDGPSWLTESDDYTAKQLIEDLRAEEIICIDWSSPKNEYMFK